jgi:subtilisin family serine protease
VEEDSKVDRVIDAAHDKFDAVLDVRTDSDPALFLEAGRVKKAPQNPWPAWTGMKAARVDRVRGNGVLVGVLDTGVDADHGEFKKRSVEFRYVPPGAVQPSEGGRNLRGFDTDGHGTHVCGIVAGAHVGVAPDVNLHVAAVIESETLRASLWRTVYGLDWMFRLFTEKKYVRIPCVINLSLCFFENRMETEEIDDWKLLLSRAVEDLHRKDALVVAAAGNLGRGNIGFPASFDNVLAVGAVDRDRNVAKFSGTPTPAARRDIYGIGVNVMSSVERDRDSGSYYAPWSGTSMAAPYVTGIAALCRSTNPRATAGEVRDHLLTSAIAGERGVPVARFQHWK